MSHTDRPGNTSVQHDTIWGAQASGWAKHWAHLADPARSAVAATTGIGPGLRVLDIGCGTGEFCRLASLRGATVSGIDSAAGMINLARQRLPDADLQVGSAMRLPWVAETFDLVTAFNSLQYSEDIDEALREARRVARPGGHVVLCQWGGRQDCELAPILEALKPTPEQASQPIGIAELEQSARHSGLTPVSTAEIAVPYQVADRATLRQALLVDAALVGTDQDAEHTLQTALHLADSFRRSDGSYRFENRFQYLLTTVQN